MMYELDKSCQNAEQIAVNCKLSAEIIVNNESINDFLNQIASDKKFSFMDILDFYGKEISGVQKIVKSNPYIYKLRMFVHSESVKEIIPLLYKEDRIADLKWGKDGVPATGTWCFDYVDTLEQEEDPQHIPRIASLITRLNDYRYGRYGIVESAVTMENMFPDLYHSTVSDRTCFVDQAGTIYSSPELSDLFNSQKKDIMDFLNNQDQAELNRNGAVCKRTRLGGEEVIAGYVKIKSIQGYLIRIVSTKNDEMILRSSRIEILLLWIAIVIVLLLFSNRQVTHILRQFYEIYNTVYRVQQGDLEVRVQNMSRDEFGVLGIEINTMLDRIQRLMEETLQRELLVKNSQIKALQNQINNHFIYNVLESVKMMAEIDEKYEIADTVSSFGQLLRYSMRWKTGYVKVEEEIEHIRNYLALVNLWYDDEICLRMEIPQEILFQEIPKMSLQPIVENSISHGMREYTQDTNIYMEGEIIGGDCYIRITDFGCGMDEGELLQLNKRLTGEREDQSGQENGIGLKNVHDRLQIGFGTGYGIVIESEKHHYTRVTIKIPYQKRKRGLI
ncbi:sensor histidine kinase [Lacrimispora amygdalina]|uniref:sensor histidine kinase n=1 Tax=Lacrimispora amygdalina TaxID=253257 RepID=UPI00140AD188|nr:sensor histidine kinase [Lacrimispora amygdalina]